MADMLTSLQDMMSALHFFDLFNLDRTKFQNFIREMRKTYRRNPYHNFVHAMDVTQVRTLPSFSFAISSTSSQGGMGCPLLQFVFACLNVAEVRQCLTDLDALSLFFGAMCHDLDHPGTNNNFQMNASTELAIRYNGTPGPIAVYVEIQIDA